MSGVAVGDSNLNVRPASPSCEISGVWAYTPIHLDQTPVLGETRRRIRTHIARDFAADPNTRGK